MMMTKKRFDLKSIHFNKTVELFDSKKCEYLLLSIYELVDLLNEVSESEYTLYNLKEDIIEKLNEIGDVE